MPRYEYVCGACNKDVIIQHLSDEVVSKCPECDKDSSLTKKLTTFRTQEKPSKRGGKVGETTEDFIKSSREELRQQKKELHEKR